MADIRREQYLVVDDFWQFRIGDDGDTIYMGAVADEYGEYGHLATSFSSAEFIAALRSMGAAMPMEGDT